MSVHKNTSKSRVNQAEDRRRVKPESPDRKVRTTKSTRPTSQGDSSKRLHRLRPEERPSPSTNSRDADKSQRHWAKSGKRRVDQRVTSEKPAKKPPKKSSKIPRGDNVDVRKQLWNGGKMGPIEQIQCGLDQLTQLRGILFDIDPQLLQRGALTPRLSDDPERFYERTIQPMLANHPVFAKSEVRLSGTGLHVILKFDKPVPLETPADRERWATIVQLVQALLPADPRQPGITAVTRKLGSINSKNGEKVCRLAEGGNVTAEEVIALADAARHRPFRTMLQILAGSERVSPCPICEEDDAAMLASDHCGHCYRCGLTNVEELLSSVYRGNAE